MLWQVVGGSFSPTISLDYYVTHAQPSRRPGDKSVSTTTNFSEVKPKIESIYADSDSSIEAKEKSKGGEQRQRQDGSKQGTGATEQSRATAKAAEEQEGRVQIAIQ